MLLTAASPAAAHDYWLEPDTFFPQLNSSVALRLLIGDGFVNEQERPFQKKLTLRLELIGAGKTTDLAALAEEGRKPLAKVHIDKPGCYWVVLDRDWAYLTLEAKKFSAYLLEEGLQNILDERAKAKEMNQPGKERYRRYLKCLLRAGAESDDAWKRTFGQALEIVPLANPAGLKVGDTLHVKVLFEGKPLTKAPTFAHARSGKDVNRTALKTDQQGIAAIPLKSTGPWLVRLVHMRRCTADAKVDWESHWSSFTFSLR